MDVRAENTTYIGSILVWGIKLVKELQGKSYLSVSSPTPLTEHAPWAPSALSKTLTLVVD